MTSLANRGQNLERALDTMHAVYTAQRRASVMRVPTPLRILGHAGHSGGSLICVPDHAGEPDYIVQVRGRSLMLDAKECAESRWPLAHLPEHQAARFDAHTAQGGFAFVLLQLDRALYLLPWGVPEHPSAGLAGRWHRAKAIQAGGPRPANGWASLNSVDCVGIGALLRSYDWLDAARGMCS